MPYIVIRETYASDDDDAPMVARTVAAGPFATERAARAAARRLRADLTPNETLTIEEQAS